MGPPEAAQPDDFASAVVRNSAPGLVENGPGRTLSKARAPTIQLANVRGPL